MQVIDRRGDPLGWGLPSESSAIAVRMLGWGADPPPDDWLARRLRRAFTARSTQGFADQPTTGIRMVNSEGDGLPGLVVDRYDETLVVQLTTAPMAARRDAILSELRSLHPGPIHTVLPTTAAKLEGFEAGVVREGDDPWLRFIEHGLRLQVPAPPSHKTGAYFDQRANRRWVAELARAGEGPLLDLGCHVGGFGLHAAAAGVPAVGVDQSAAMLELARDNAARNDLGNLSFIEADMFGPLDDPQLAGPFGTMVIDPPKMAARRRDVDRAAGAMRRLVGRVAPRLRPGGHVALCSCSHHLGVDQLDACILATAGSWTRVAVRGADVDHPIAPAHVEGEYLRVAVYQRRS